MNCHFRRYCFYLASQLKMTVRELLEKLDSRELAEWMAYDMTQNTEWQKSYQVEKELEESKKMTDMQQLQAFKALLGGK